MSLESLIVCSACSVSLDGPSDGWPDEANGLLCQGCWEAYASRTWWGMLKSLPDLSAEDATDDHRG